MIEFMIWVLATCGLTALIVDSKIFSPIRSLINKWGPEPLKQLVACYQCVGAWSGMITAWLMLPALTIPGLLIFATAGSFVSMSAAIVLNRLER